jgi:anaerobic magnesium-protoporphyrin IX monomethyl ester cyclase
MRVLFFYPNYLQAPSIHYGIASISGVLKESGHQAKVIQLLTFPKKKEVLKYVKEFSPDLVALTSTTNQFQIAEAVAGFIKSECDIPIVCGGVHATFAPDEVIRGNIDFVCRGEGEYAMLELVDSLERGASCDNIKNLWIKKNGNIIKNELRPFISELDKLPFPDVDVFDVDFILKRNTGMFRVMGDRRCTYNCTYCCSSALRELYKDEKWPIRHQSIDSRLGQMEFWRKKYPIKSFIIDDDVFTLDHRYTIEFCQRYKEMFDLPFACNARLETLDKGLLKILKSSGCYCVLIGIESGNEWIRKNVLHRNIANEKIVRIFKEVKESGLKVHSFNMIGLPYETQEAARDTVKLNREISPDTLQVSVFYPYPGTELYNLYKKNNFTVKKGVFNYLNCNTELERLTSINPVQINAYFWQINNVWIEQKIYFRCKYLYFVYWILKKILGVKTVTVLSLRLNSFKNYVAYNYIWKLNNYMQNITR